jgi:hypothetical protein
VSTRIVTAETEEGRAAIEEVMAHSYRAELGVVPPAWERALVVDGVPVSFVVVNPDGAVALPGGRLRAAWVRDVATREDRRREGHFRRLMEMTSTDLCAAGVFLLTLHGTCRYYRPLGFCVCTHHCGLFATPDGIEQRLGPAPEAVRGDLLEVEDNRHISADLLVVAEVRAWTCADAAAALLAAAALARTRGKTRVVFEHPRSDHTLHPSLETPFTEMARLCGAEMIVVAADPEGRRVDHADWYKVLDTYRFLRDAVPLRPVKEEALPTAAVTFETDAGTATVRGSPQGIAVTEGAAPDACRVTWPANAVGQLALGYLSAAALAAVHGTPIPLEPLALLDLVFPRWWRLSRNEAWVYGE